MVAEPGAEGQSIDQVQLGDDIVGLNISAAKPPALFVAIAERIPAFTPEPVFGFPYLPADPSQRFQLIPVQSIEDSLCLPVFIRQAQLISNPFKYGRIFGGFPLFYTQIRDLCKPNPIAPEAANKKRAVGFVTPRPSTCDQMWEIEGAKEGLERFPTTFFNTSDAL